MKRPVWLFSLDSEKFEAVPMTTGGLAAYFQRYGNTSKDTELELVHFFRPEEISEWFERRWQKECLKVARLALASGYQPVVGFSFYAWNTAEFLDLIKRLRKTCPQLLVVAGGPHVQRPEEFLTGEGIDVVVLGEGEVTFQELLDCTGMDQWSQVAGLAYINSEGTLYRTDIRQRITDLNILPSALDIIELRDSDGSPLYKTVGYETSRGCPYRCAFCEWGTGALGTKVYQYSLSRIRHDLERLVEGGIEDVWLCDANFGSLADDLEKARILLELHKKTGRPKNFAASWAKRYNRRTHEAIILLHRAGILQHYNLALQTITPSALELCHRKNLKIHVYTEIAKSLTEAGVPIAVELIWGLPGDNLMDFETNLDRLEALFPNINIFGYTLLPGTEFDRRRDEYRIETIPVAGYGKAKGEYVIGCHSFNKNEGMQGYSLITAHIILIRGHIIPLTTRLLALGGHIPISPMLRTIFRELSREFAGDLNNIDLDDGIALYEHRSQFYLLLIAQQERCFAVIHRAIDNTLLQYEDHLDLIELKEQVTNLLMLDKACCPKAGPRRTIEYQFNFCADEVKKHLSRMELPPKECFRRGSIHRLRIDHPAQVGEILTDPDGGSWMQGTIISSVLMGAV